MIRLYRWIVLLALINQTTWDLQSFAVEPASPSQPSAPEHEFAADDLDFFEKKIRPVLVKHCEECHSEAAAKSNRLKGGLYVDSREGLLTGGESGSAVVPGEPDKSLLMKAIQYDSLEMPPQGKLPASVIEDFEQWIAKGVADPRIGQAMAASSKKIDLIAGREHWAYRPLQQTTTPTVSNSLSHPASPVDAFVMSRLQSEHLEPAPEATRTVMIRRVFFDLVGLPPTPQDIDSFLSDARPDALERIVDQLMASPRFGERWSRHWLSVVRFAESITLRGSVFPEAWRYRDYVIDALNSDLSYDRFVMEQIAGDLYPAETLLQRQQQRIATTFLALGNNNLEEQDKQQLRMDVVDEQLEAICKGFLAQTIGCARCHDHKFDPIPTRDYYAMAGILANVKTLEDANVSTWIELPLPVEPDQEALFASHEAQVAELQAKIKSVQDAQRKPSIPVADAATSSEADRKEASQLNEQLNQLKKELKALTSAGPQRPKYMTVKEEERITDIPVHIRGTVHNLGETVPRGFMQVLDFQEPRPLTTSQSGRRELAEWIVHRDNSLAARVIANRVWHWLFKSGLCRSPDNFGTTGDRPVQIELLDHLARRLLERKWSLKPLIREIVTTRTYGLSSETSPSNQLTDPENRLLARRSHSRLDAECLLDAFLTVSDQRIDDMGGPSTMNRITEDYGYVHDNCRRAVYWPVFRNSLPEIFETFDFADPSLPTGSRTVSTVATQSLFFLNNPWVDRQARLAAQRVLNESATGYDQRIDLAFRLTLGRYPSDHEKQIAIKNLTRETSQEEMWTDLFKGLFGSIDFRYVE